MIFSDDRTKAQKEELPIVVMMTDRFLSGWGHAGNGPSYAGWACRFDDQYRVERWVRSRTDAMRVTLVGPDYRPPSIEGHCQIYVVEEGHPALR